MMNDRHKELMTLLNSSGFPFQMAIEYQVRSSRGVHNWEVVSTEHPWARSGSSGFIDLVIRRSNVVWVVECKRTQNATWLFIIPMGAQSTENHIRCLWSIKNPAPKTQSSGSIQGWDDFLLAPPSYEASFCAIRGTEDKDKSFLENLSARLARSTDALADEEYQITNRREIPFQRIYMPVIVTNATLQVARIDPSSISLHDGLAQTENFEPQQILRFRKTFTSDLPPRSQPECLETAASLRERTVLIISASNLVDILASTTMSRSFGQPWPWEVALDQIKMTVGH